MVILLFFALQDVDAFAGTWEGTCTFGDQVMVSEWTLNKTVLTQRNRVTKDGQTLFEDLRVFSGRKMRQWTEGVMREYDVERKGDTFTFTQSKAEGAKDTWKYVYTLGDSISYVLEVDGKEFVKGTLKSKLPDPGQLGRYKFKEFQETIDGMEAYVVHPEEGGPFPTIVLSPGGGAETYEGYEGFGRWFASWGYATVIVAFADEQAEDRAKKFSKVLDELEKKPYADAKKFVAMGHSRGGYASVIAATGEKRFVACVALCPSGPEKIEGKHRPAMCLISGDDGDEKICAKLYGAVAKPRVQVTVEGMDHFFNPQGKALFVVKYAIVFLEAEVRGDARYRALLKGEKGVRIAAD